MKIEKNSLYGTFKDSFEYSKPDYISEAVSLINSYGVNIDEIEVRERYSEPHRHFHTIEHLNDVLGQVFELYKNSVDLPEMVMSAVFHDIIYDPQRKDNEEKSAELFEKCIDSKKLPLKMYLLSKKIILATKTHDKVYELISNFNKIDCSILDRGFADLLKWEEEIHKEYEFAGDLYKERRLKFLELSIPVHMDNIENLHRLIKYIKKLY